MCALLSLTLLPRLLRLQRDLTRTTASLLLSTEKTFSTGIFLSNAFISIFFTSVCFFGGISSMLPATMIGELGRPCSNNFVNTDKGIIDRDGSHTETRAGSKAA